MRIKAILRDSRGVTVIEFALIMPLLVMFLLGAMDLGYYAYSQGVTQGVVQRASRAASVGGVTATNTDNFIRTEIRAALSNSATITINKSAYRDFTSVKQPEKIVTDTAPLGSYNTGDCYLDANGNSTWDSDMGKSGQLGDAEDVVFYDVTTTMPRLFPLASMIGMPENQISRAKAIIKNQPYDAQPAAVATCRT